MFLIPPTVGCRTTWTRDELEVIYIDMMAVFVSKAEELGGDFGVEDLPFTKMGNSLLSRLWNRFNVWKDSTVGWVVWAKLGLMVPGEILYLKLLDQEDWDYDELKQTYPTVPSWWSTERFPPGVPICSLLVVYYFYGNIRRAQVEKDERPRVAAFWDRVVELEYAALYSAFWWHEASRGMRAYIIPTNTVRHLATCIGDLPLEKSDDLGGRNVSFKYVADRMLQVQMSADKDPKVVNSLSIQGTRLPTTYFLQSDLQLGTPVLQADGMSFFRKWRNGRIYYDGLMDDYGHAVLLNRRQPRPVKTMFKKRWDRRNGHQTRG